MQVGGCGVCVCGQSRKGPLQEFVEKARCYAELPRREHRPEFRVVPVREAAYRGKLFWITDGGQRIGIVNLALGEIELMRFSPPVAGSRERFTLPAMYDWRTLRGARICMVPQSTWSGRGTVAYPEDRGERLTLRYREAIDSGTHMEHVFTLRFDGLLGYVLDGAFDLRMKKPREFEYTNILAGGLMESRDDRKRYQKCIWTRRDGTFCYQYQSPLSRMQAAGPKWAEVPESAFVGWVAERDMNPFLEIMTASPTRFATCGMWYDQHVFGKPPSAKDSDGFYHINATYRMLSLPLPLAKELEDAARAMLPSIGMQTPVGFRQGVRNDCETLVPHGTLYNGCLWTRAAEWDQRVGHSGAKSLRVRGGSVAEPIRAGTGILLESGRRYRFGAWVRTRGVTGGAYLRLHEVFSSWQDVRAAHRTRRIRGDRDWTWLAVEFTPVKNDPMALPGLVVEGRGQAWFDDIELVEAGSMSP